MNQPRYGRRNEEGLEDDPALSPDVDPDGPTADGSPARESVESLIGAGEGQRTEFKSSFRVEAGTRLVNKDLTKVIAKTIAGFMNTQGGSLLIGVADDGSVVGVEGDVATLSRKTLDGFELALRQAVANHLGPTVGPHLNLRFVVIDGQTVALVECPRHSQPVFFQDGDRQEFYIRDGNRTQPLDIRSAHEFIQAEWRTQLQGADIKDVVLDALRERLGDAPPRASQVHDLPPWLSVATRRVVDMFLRTLAGSHGWKRLYVISPWISEFDTSASLSFERLLSRLRDDRTTAYVVTRPPEAPWHDRAVRMLGETGRANIALVPDLHMKLYTALTSVGDFALVGSANFTQQSLANREIGVLVNGFSDGKLVVSELNYEASQIYCTQGRRLIYKAAF